MLNRWSGPSVQRSAEAACIEGAVEHDPRLKTAATMLVVARAGIVFSDEAIEAVAGSLADLAKDCGASPDIVQRALIENELTLGFEWPHDGGPANGSEAIGYY